jgi:hypothetical protein
MAVVFGPHPSNIAIPSFAYFLYEMFGMKLMAVAKVELLGNILGWLLDRTGTGIFVDRSSAERSRVSIRNTIKKLIANWAVVIFPDHSRPTRKKIDVDREKFGKKFPEICEWLNHTLFPRAGALFEMLQILRGNGRKVRLFLVVSALNVRDDGPLGFWRAYRSKYRFVVREIDLANVPETSAEFKVWLTNLWADINRLIHKWRQARRE